MLRVVVFAGLALAHPSKGLDDDHLPKSLSYSEEYCYETVAADGHDVSHPKSRPCYRNPDVYEASTSSINQSESAIVQTTTLVRSRSTTIATIIVDISTLTTTFAGGTSDAAPPVSSPCTDETTQPAGYEYTCSTITTTTTTTTTTASATGTAAPVISSHSYSQPESHSGTATSSSDNDPPVVTGGAAAVNAVGITAVRAMAGLFLFALV